jgi:hypothetical protein
VPVNGVTEAKTIRVEQPDDLRSAAAEIGLTPTPLAVVIVGGADGMGVAAVSELEGVFAHAVVPLVTQAGGVVVDGGTDTGVMRASGRARASARASFPLVGVLPGSLASTVRLEPNHTHFFLIPGSQWGDESPWLPRIAKTLGGRQVCVVAGGGTVAGTDVEVIRAAGIAVVALTGSGGLADRLTARDGVEAAPLEDRAAVADALARLS